MVQHNVKQKVKLPAGVSVKKNQASTSGMIRKGPKKGVKKEIKPKSAERAKMAKIQQDVTKFINKQNEELIAARAAGPSSA